MSNEVREEWTATDIGSLFAVNTPGHWGDDGESEGNILVLRSANFLKAGGLKYETAALRRFDEKKLGQKLLKPGDILLERSGGSPSQPVGRVNRFDATGDFSASNFLQILRAHEGVDDWFAYYLLDEFYVAGGTQNLQKATTGIRNLDFTTYLATTVPLPPLAEQRRIAEVLRSVDEATEAQDRVCRQLSVAFNATLEACLAAAEWPAHRLGDLCDSIQVGIVVKPASYYVDSGGVPALRSLNVLENRLALDDLVYISEAGHSANQKSALRAGDVVTRRTGEPGKTAMIPSGFESGLNCIDIIFSRPKDCLHPAYLSFFMNSVSAKRQVAGLQGGLAQQHLNVGEMKKLVLPLPDLQTQVHTAEVLDDISANMEAARLALLKLSSLKANLASDLLSGRVRVPA